MLTFMEYIQNAFNESSNWNRHNSYSSLTYTARSLLDFTTPEGLRLHVSSLASPNFATSYTLGTIGVIDGSLSYLFSSIPLHPPSQSSSIRLRSIAEGYKQITRPRKSDEAWWWEIWKGGKRVKRKDTLLHATLHLPPPSTLHALFLRRLSPTVLLSFSLASSAPTGATVLTHLHHDVGKYSTEYLFSTDSVLLGFRGLWNFGPDPRDESPSDPYNPPSLLSAGAEAYYSPLSSLAGISTGLRFTTLPGSSSHPNNSSHSHSTFPYTLALTLTPLTGSLETTYSVRASPNLAMSSRFGFNVYSWESEIVLGWEIWRRRRRAQLPTELPGHFIETDWIYDRLTQQRNAARQVPKNAFDVDEEVDSSDFDPDPWRTAAALQTRTTENEKDDSVLKIRIDQSWNVRLLWEGRMKELLLSAGVSLGPGMKMGSGHGVIDGRGMGLGWRGVGVELSYSS